MIRSLVSIVCAAGFYVGAAVAGDTGQDPGSFRVRSDETAEELGWTGGELSLASVPGYPGESIKVLYKGERHGKLNSFKVSTSTWSQELSSIIPANAVSFPSRTVLSARASEGEVIDTISLSLPVLIASEGKGTDRECHVLDLYVRKGKPVQDLLTDAESNRCRQ